MCLRCVWASCSLEGRGIPSTCWQLLKTLAMKPPPSLQVVHQTRQVKLPAKDVPILHLRPHPLLQVLQLARMQLAMLPVPVMNLPRPP
jgi:hypothetical protein